MAQVVEHSVSPRTVITVAVAGLIVVTLWQLTTALLVFFSALLLASALNPLVQRLHKLLPVSLSAIVILVILFLPVVWVVATAVPSFLVKLPTIVATIGVAVSSTPYLPYSIRTIDFTQYADNLAQFILASTAQIAAVLGWAASLIVLTYYIIMDREKLQRLFLSLVPDKEQGSFRVLADELARISGQYIRGNLLISFICIVCIFTGLVALGVPYPGQLAVLAGILDLFPLIGAVSGAVPAAILALLVSPLTAVLTVFFYIVYQEIENYFISPKIYNKALNLMPTLTLVSVIIGASLFGLAGAFLSLPIAAALPVLTEFYKKRKLSA